MSYPSYKLTLQKTYYDKGFFNLGVSVERYIRPDSGEIKIILGSSKTELNGTVNREANLNGTPRIFGGLELRNWIQSHHKFKDVVEVSVLSPDKIWIK